MKIIKDEIINKLAEAVNEFYYESNYNGGYDTCRYCGCRLNYNHVKIVGTHESDCPVILAGEVLRKCEDGEMGIKCSFCEGTGLKK